MKRTHEEHLVAINKIRDYAGAYKGKRKDFYDNLYAMLATPIPRSDNYNAIVEKMYFAAIGALTSEIQPPTDETYVEVVKRLNSVLSTEKLGAIKIAIYSDEGVDNGYRIAGEAQKRDSAAPRIEQLQDALPRKRRMTNRNQALVDKFRAEIPSKVRPFENRGQQRG